MSGSKKQKLTLSVNKEAIQKARKVGLNLSEITEKVLQGFTAAPSDADEAEVRSHYQVLFNSMLPLMKQYDIVVQVAYEEDFDDVGNAIGEYDYNLLPSGTVIMNFMDTTSDAPLEKIPITAFYDPNAILTIFIDKLSSAKQKNQQTIEKLQLAKRIIDVMTESVGPKTGKAGTEKSSVIEHASH